LSEPKEEPKQFWVSSIYGAKTREPLVQFSFDGKIIQMSPEQAREIAAHTMDAAASAEVDGMLYGFAEEEGMSLEAGAQLVEKFRKFRGFYKSGGHEADKTGKSDA